MGRQLTVLSSDIVGIPAALEDQMRAASEFQPGGWTPAAGGWCRTQVLSLWPELRDLHPSHLSRSGFCSSLYPDPQPLSSLLKSVLRGSLGHSKHYFVGLLSWSLLLEWNQLRVANSVPTGPGRFGK